MKQHQISELPKLDGECLENLFNVYVDKDAGFFFYNLLQTIVIPNNLPPSVYTKYTIEPADTWPMISYKNYDTPNLWWVILYVNNIFDPTKPLVSGQKINILKIDLVKEILTQIRR